jgi:hypothetical protein
MTLFGFDLSELMSVLRVGVADEANLASFEAEVGFRLPEDFRTFALSPHGGFYVSTKCAPRITLKVFGLAPGLPAWLDIRKQQRPPGLVPFLQRNSVTYGFDARGRIVRLQDCRNSAVPTTFSQLVQGQLRRMTASDDTVSLAP